MVEPMTRSIVHAHLAHAIADRFAVAKEAALEPTDAGADLVAGALIGKRIQPGHERFALQNIEHTSTDSGTRALEQA